VSTNNEIKLKKLLDLHVPGTVILASWLDENGFSHDLQQRYRRSGWLESVGVGAFKRPNENLSWQGAIFSLQKQGRLSLHAGGLTALSYLGYSHYIRTGLETVYVFSDLKTTLPSWFKKYPWKESIKHIKTSFLPVNLGLHENNEKQFQITISTAERAIFECLYLCPEKMDLLEVYQILSGMVNLRPELIQKLLEECNSVKVKRLFLFMLKKSNHQWGNFLTLNNVTLGTGDRSIVKNGIYDSEYRITVPKELAQL
jgi:hypothetical protein